MIGKLIVEIIILWIYYAGYMAFLVHSRGPLGGIFFYPKVMQTRVVEMGLITDKEIKKRKTFAWLLLLVLLLLIPGVMILCVNGARSYFECCWQFYVLFLGAELFDWLVLDTIWVAMSDWWLIPGTEDLNDTWHNVHVKQWKMVKLIPVGIPIAAMIGAFYWIMGRLM